MYEPWKPSTRCAEVPDSATKIIADANRIIFPAVVLSTKMGSHRRPHYYNNNATSSTDNHPIVIGEELQLEATSSFKTNSSTTTINEVQHQCSYKKLVTPCYELVDLRLPLALDKVLRGGYNVPIPGFLHQSAGGQQYRNNNNTTSSLSAPGTSGDGKHSTATSGSLSGLSSQKPFRSSSEVQIKKVKITRLKSSQCYFIPFLLSHTCGWVGTKQQQKNIATPQDGPASEDELFSKSALVLQGPVNSGKTTAICIALSALLSQRAPSFRGLPLALVLVSSREQETVMKGMLISMLFPAYHQLCRPKARGRGGRGGGSGERGIGRGGGSNQSISEAPTIVARSIVNHFNSVVIVQNLYNLERDLVNLRSYPYRNGMGGDGSSSETPPRLDGGCMPKGWLSSLQFVVFDAVDSVTTAPMATNLPPAFKRLMKRLGEANNNNPTSGIVDGQGVLSIPLNRNSAPIIPSDVNPPKVGFTSAEIEHCLEMDFKAPYQESGHIVNFWLLFNGWSCGSAGGINSQHNNVIKSNGQRQRRTTRNDQGLYNFVSQYLHRHALLGCVQIDEGCWYSVIHDVCEVTEPSEILPVVAEMIPKVPLKGTTLIVVGNKAEAQEVEAAVSKILSCLPHEGKEGSSLGEKTHSALIERKESKGVGDRKKTETEIKILKGLQVCNNYNNADIIGDNVFLEIDNNNKPATSSWQCRNVKQPSKARIRALNSIVDDFTEDYNKMRTEGSPSTGMGSLLDMKRFLYLLDTAENNNNNSQGLSPSVGVVPSLIGHKATRDKNVPVTQDKNQQITTVDVLDYFQKNVVFITEFHLRTRTFPHFSDVRHIINVSISDTNDLEQHLNTLSHLYGSMNYVNVMTSIVARNVMVDVNRVRGERHGRLGPPSEQFITNNNNQQPPSVSIHAAPITKEKDQRHEISLSKLAKALKATRQRLPKFLEQYLTYKPPVVYRGNNTVRSRGNAAFLSAGEPSDPYNQEEDQDISNNYNNKRNRDSDGYCDDGY